MLLIFVEGGVVSVRTDGVGVWDEGGRGWGEAIPEAFGGRHGEAKLDPSGRALNFLGSLYLLLLAQSKGVSTKNTDA